MVQIPKDFYDLLDNPVVVQLATVMPNGQPQVTPVWAERHGNEVWVNTAHGRQKDENLRARPQATVAILDPTNPYRWIELRCEVAEIVDGEFAHAQIDRMAHAYFGRGFTFSAGEKRVLFKLRPTRITHS
jgi:PPOX class probable F420-dependent enzyme